MASEESFSIREGNLILMLFDIQYKDSKLMGESW